MEEEREGTEKETEKRAERGGVETGSQGQEWWERRKKKEGGRKRERKREGEMGGGQGPPFNREHSVCAQEVLLLAAVEDLSCQEPRGRPVQMSEYYTPPALSPNPLCSPNQLFLS